MKVRSWFAIEIVADPRAADAVEHCLNELGAIGTEIDQLRKKSDADVMVVGYFENPTDTSEVNEQLEIVLAAFEFDNSYIRSISQRRVEDVDWLAEWKKHWRPTRVGRFLIAPSWFEVNEVSGDVLIRIEPNMAFGTGTHETTRLCLGAIDRYYRPQMTFLDVGTGTGILAIAAAKVGGETARIVAIDTDADSIAIARENAALNGVGEIEFHVGSKDVVKDTFDVVCANLTLDVISPMLTKLVKAAARMLVLSGILAEQEADISQQLDELAVNHEVERDGEWISVVCRV